MDVKEEEGRKVVDRILLLYDHLVFVAI